MRQIDNNHRLHTSDEQKFARNVFDYWRIWLSVNGFEDGRVLKLCEFHVDVE